MSIDLGNTPTGTPPTPAEKEQLRTVIGLSDAIVATADGKYPALDGSLIANVVGEQGLTGIQGLQGGTGADGADGIQGIQGNDGAAGAAGAAGDTGPQGPTGPQGAEGLMPNVDNLLIGPEGPAGVVEGLDDILARITSLETYSPLTNVSAGTVSDITYKNKEEIFLSEKLQNTTIVSEGVIVPWTPELLNGTNMKLWLDASELTTVEDTWTNKALQGIGDVTLVGDNANNDLYISELNGLGVMEYSANDGVSDLHHTFPVNTSVTSCFWVIRRTGGSGNLLGGTFDFIAEWQNQSYFKPNWGPDPANIDVKTNGGTMTGFSTSDYQIISYVNNWPVGSVVSNFGHSNNFSKFTHTANGYFQGGLAELIIFDTQLSTSDVERVEGYLSAKWSIDLDALHPFRQNSPNDPNAIGAPSWTVSSGRWDTDSLTAGILKGSPANVAAVQTVETTTGEIYDVTITRADTDEGLVVKLRTSSNVRWLSHDDDITNEVDVPFSSTATFQVVGAEVVWIEVDTVNSTNQVTSVSMIHKKLALGSVEVLTNNTIKKTAGVDGWNAGASSTEFINGQGEGYVQFQMGQSGKDIKVGLTHNDVDYINTAPYQMLFSETSISIQGFVRDTYVSGDWFRIKHDSVNNQIVYQKRDSNLDYQTIYADSLTTDGRNLYLDTSFFHTDGRINDVSLIN